MKCPRIYTAQAIDDHTLMIEFTNQQVKKYDIRHLLENPMFAPLRQPAFFKNFKVEKGGYAIVWNEEIDLSEYELWKNGVTVAQSEFIALETQRPY
ncbi:MAG: DUF2442 domain-containing protein [Scytonema sp. PMC 1069.18]|nr:DUF2442 domain-containing protein [Scytonema sp. PMC 1069.18]MEC4879754.1 DUF2442 domain-containing protein [Scytonema sp. PMC 1070.18]